jgi:leucyl-tRNA synthetase
VYDGKIFLDGDLKDLHRKTHTTIKKVTSDIEDRFHFNTAISAIMELVNDTYKVLGADHGDEALKGSVVREAVESTLLLLSPVVPHVAEELWQMLGKKARLLNMPWPKFRTEALEVEKQLVVIQVNGKVRDRIEVPSTFSDKDIEAAALQSDRLKSFMGEKPIRKVIVVGK